MMTIVPFRLLLLIKMLPIAGSLADTFTLWEDWGHVSSYLVTVCKI